MTIEHASDCAVHNEPAMPAGPCTCGVAEQAVRAHVMSVARSSLSAEQSPEALAERAVQLAGAVDKLEQSSSFRREVARVLNDCAVLLRTPAESTSAPSRAEGVGLTEAQTRMLRFLDTVGRPYDDVKPGQVGMLRLLEERGLVSRGSISHLRPRWSLTPAGRALLAPQDGASQPAATAGVREALEELNAALDAMWNDGASGAIRGKHQKAILAAQRKSQAALAAPPQPAAEWRCAADEKPTPPPEDRLLLLWSKRFQYAEVHHVKAGEALPPCTLSFGSSWRWVDTP